MRDWLPYSGAFALGLLAATADFWMGFIFVMSAPITFIALFFGVVVLVPMLAGLLIFGLLYRLFSGVRFSGLQWLVAFGMVVMVALFCFALIVGDVLEELPATVLMMALLFAGGRIGLPRTDHA